MGMRERDGMGEEASAQGGVAGIHLRMVLTGTELVSILHLQRTCSPHLSAWAIGMSTALSPPPSACPTPSWRWSVGRSSQLGLLQYL